MAVKVKKGTIPKGGININQIDIRTINRKTQDIENWRTAIRSFESIMNPSRVLLYDMYDDIMLDGQIVAVWNKRKDAILNKTLICSKDGKSHEELEKMLNSPSMNELISDLLDTVIYGYTLIQINNIWWNEEEEQYNIDYDLIPRKHVHPEPGFECISVQQSGTSRDFPYKEPPLNRYMIWAGKEKNMGLLCPAVQYVVYKRGGFGDWSQFAEMFGAPFREATYPAYDNETREKLIREMEEFGGFNYLVHPEGTAITFHEMQSAAGSSTVYKDLKDSCNAEISKIILGNTMTTEQGENGARSLGEVHLTVEEQKHKADERFILSILNTQFRSILKRFGFDISGWEIWFETPESDWDNMQKKFNVISGVADRVPVADDFWYEEFDIPKPDNYEELKEEMRTAKAINPFAQFPALQNPLAADDNTPAQKVEKKKAQNLLGRALSFFV
ncbi:MAG: DUF935 domain-containing protein [Bacteroidales bacterium]|jgi:hypothetical protein|nr:DUF935 domain-containing protein [Bacteroidales bacterium]